MFSSVSKYVNESETMENKNKTGLKILKPLKKNLNHKIYNYKIAWILWILLAINISKITLLLQHSAIMPALRLLLQINMLAGLRSSSTQVPQATNFWFRATRKA